MTETPLEETLRALDDLVSQGKVLYIGFSQWSAPQIADAVKFQETHNLDRFVSSQPYYNMLGRDIGKSRDPGLRARRHRADRVFATGAGRADGQVQARPARSRRQPRRRPQAEQVPELEDGKLADQAQAGKGAEAGPHRAKGLGLSMPQLALAWCLRQPNVSSVIIGASKPSQVEDNAGASGVTLDQDTLKAIDEALA